MRGKTSRGVQWGGWLHELGDISPPQAMIIALAKGTQAMDWVLQMCNWDGCGVVPRGFCTSLVMYFDVLYHILHLNVSQRA